MTRLDCQWLDKLILAFGYLINREDISVIQPRFTIVKISFSMEVH